MPTPIFRVQVGSLSLQAIEAKVSWKQNEVNEFEILVFNSDIIGSGIGFLTNVSIFLDNVLVISGYLYDEPKLELGENQKVLARLFCYDELGRLMCKRRITASHYQNLTLVAILTDLLNLNTTNWELGALSLVDPLIVTTVDLRAKETLWAQVMGAIESAPQTFVRYGGFNTLTNRHKLDVGFLGELYHPDLRLGNNLTSLTLEKSSNRIYSLVQAIGGDSADTPVTLQGALNINPALAFDPDYPIVTIGSDLVVVNNAVGIGNGCEIAKDFQVNKTENSTPPTQAEQDEAGHALYQEAVRFLQENQPAIKFNASAFLPTIPPISSTIFVHGKVREHIWDSVREITTSIETFAISDSYRIVSIEMAMLSGTIFDAISGDLLTNVEYSLELTDSDYGEFRDDAIDIYKRVEKYNNFDSNRSVNPSYTISDTLTHGPGVPSDCVQPGPVNGKIFTVPLPASPSWATSVSATYQVSPPSAVVQVTQNPALPATDWIGCISVAGTWTVASTATITVIFVFS